MHLVTDTADYVLENPPLSLVEAEASEQPLLKGLRFLDHAPLPLSKTPYG
jgi:hypothetical protein